jgi:hypothetical protein
VNTDPLAVAYQEIMRANFFKIILRKNKIEHCRRDLRIERILILSAILIFIIFYSIGNFINNLYC